ncbi:MAG TPA: uracil phosphoribosyltransferase [Bacteroidota bacterium]|nr:uracil phosphoribosyltransferase [Bacteroidota bacterium]
MKNIKIIDHPLVKRDLTILRDERTPSYVFRAVLRRMATLMAFEVTKDLDVRKMKVKTPLETTDGSTLEHSVVLVPILRAGLGLVGGFVEILPEAKVGHIGLYRDESTLKPVDYYFKVPRNIHDELVLVLDPMLATGGSGAEAISYLKKKGARNIRFVCLVAAPEGINVVQKRHKDVVIYTCALDRELNSKGYILPGLGDAGDRIFGTE